LKFDNKCGVSEKKSRIYVFSNICAVIRITKKEFQENNPAFRKNHTLILFEQLFV